MRSELMLLAALGALLAPAARAQAPGHRTRVRGVVRDLHGQGVEGAKVLLFGAAPHDVPELGGDDLVEVECDARGRFRAEILTARTYAACARWDNDGGETRFSGVLRATTFGEPVELGEAAEQGVRVRLELYGLENWKREGGLSVEVFDALGRSRALGLDARGHARLPLLPERSCRLVFRNVRGVQIGTRRVWTEASARRKLHEGRAKLLAEGGPAGAPVAGLPELAKEALPAPEVERVLVAPPLRVPFRVVDAKSGARIAGALVREGGLRTRYRPCLVARSDAEGRAALVTMHPIDDWGRHSARRSSHFHVYSRGHAVHYSGWGGIGGSKSLRADAIVDGRAPELVCMLAKGTVLRGRILRKAGEPAPGLAILARLVVMQKGDTVRGNPVCPPPQLLRTDAKGEFLVEGLGAMGGKRYDGICSLALVLSDAESRAAAALPAHKLPAQRVVPLDSRSGEAEGGVHRLADFDLSNLRPLDVRCSLPDGEPAAHAALDCFPVSVPWKSRMRPGFVGTPRADRLGRYRLLCLEGGARLASLTRLHYLFHEFGKLAVAEEKGVALVLEPQCFARGWVFDRKGRPIPGARLESRGMMISGRGPDAWWVSLARAHNQAALWRLADAKGRFELGIVPMRSTAFTIEAAFYGAKGRRHASTRTLRLERASVDDVELVIDVDADALPGRVKKAGGER